MADEPPKPMFEVGEVVQVENLYPSTETIWSRITERQWSEVQPPRDPYDWDMWLYLVEDDPYWQPEVNLKRLSVLEQIAWLAR